MQLTDGKIQWNETEFRKLMTSPAVKTILKKEYDRLPQNVRVKANGGTYIGEKHILKEGVKNRAYIKMSNKGRRGTDWAKRVLATSQDKALRRSAHKVLGRMGERQEG